jgi:AcrR family transcriptional regulator
MYIPRKKQEPRSRGRVMKAVRELLQEGAFHESTVEQVAARAGVSRATVYQQFGSRVGLVDAICDSLDLSAVEASPDVATLLRRTTDFWAREETLLSQLYDAAAVDPAAREFVERQTRDRYRQLPHWVDRQGLPILGLLTSFETYVELRRRAGLSQRQVVAHLQRAAADLL